MIGDKNDMSDASQAFDKFDQGAIVIYARQTGKKSDEVAQMMDDETWLLGQEAVDQGFATGLLAADAIIPEGEAPDNDEPDADDQGDGQDAQNRVKSLRYAEAILCQSMPRSDARRILNQIKGGKPDAAAPNAKQDAGAMAGIADGLRALQSTIQKGL